MFFTYRTIARRRYLANFLLDSKHFVLDAHIDAACGICIENNRAEVILTAHKAFT